MEPLDDVKNLWQKNTFQPTDTSLTKEDVAEAIKVRAKKEKNSIAEYFWLSLTFHIIIYSFSSYLLIKYRGAAQITVLTAIGVLLYIPLTIILMRKFKALYKPAEVAGDNIRTYVGKQYKTLSEFFAFKKRFDMASVPLTSIILTGILFKLYVPGGVQQHLPAALAACLAMLLVYAVAAWAENKKHFTIPLKRLRFLLDDIENKD
nr:hypothetical protein [uncultured Mucilaginibacter sp.]